MTYFSTQSPWRFASATCYQWTLFNTELWALLREPQRLLPDLTRNFGICDHHDVSSEGRKEGNHWVRSRAFTDGVRGTAIQFTVKKLPSVRLCAVTATSDFPLFGAPKKHLHDSKFQDAAKVHEAVPQYFGSQSPEFCVEGIHSLTQRWAYRVTMDKRR